VSRTTLGDKPNHICGDWASYAREYLERDHPVRRAGRLGWRADANPSPRGNSNSPSSTGSTICTAVNELARQPMTPLRQKLVCRVKPVPLP